MNKFIIVWEESDQLLEIRFQGEYSEWNKGYTKFMAVFIVVFYC